MTIIDRVYNLLKDKEWHNSQEIAKKLKTDPTRVPNKICRLEAWVIIERRWLRENNRYSRIEYRLVRVRGEKV